MSHDRNDSLSAERVQLSPDDGVFELPGADPVWLWVHTCPTPGCSCRSALVLATHDGRDQLLERGAAVRDAWNAGRKYLEVAAAIDNLIVFCLDIDINEVLSLTGNELLDLAAHPQIADIAMRIDGDTLDLIAQLWYYSKGWQDPEKEVLRATQITLKNWQRGDMVAWNNFCASLRRDCYMLDDRPYEAIEMYCPVPDCTCGEVGINFEELRPQGVSFLGYVWVGGSGSEVRFEPTKTNGNRLEQLWTAFQKRHPNYVARFVRRYAVIKSIGARIVGMPQVVSPKIGRNDPCPCGSGKKYKKCCGIH